MWKGSIAFGLVTVPVSLFPGTERSEKLSSTSSTPGTTAASTTSDSV
jgi:non-homologous end joining protein Ku